jgi:DNA-binding winged helix-turn-helix (wHTH) protein
MHTLDHQVFQFGSFRLDLTRGCVFDGDREIELRPKSFEVLRYLVENAGRLVSKDELIGRIWPNVIVNDDSRCVSDRAPSGSRRDVSRSSKPSRGAATCSQRRYRR